MTAPYGAHARHREQQIRRLLAEHAEQTFPGDGLEEIRARIAQPRPWWRRWWDAARALDRYLATGVASIALTPNKQTAARVAPRAAEPNDCLESKDMTRSIPRRAHDVHAGDIITADPDHNDRPVRWRASRRAEVTGDGVAIIDYVDLDDGSAPGIAYFGGLVTLTVEPAGGAA